MESAAATTTKESKPESPRMPRSGRSYEEELRALRTHTVPLAGMAARALKIKRSC